MGDHQRHRSQDPSVGEGSTRRHFLRRAGISGAIAAALVGVTDAAGLSQALASTKRPQNCGGGNQFCAYSPRQCNGGKACPPGYCCYHCTGCGGNYFSCIPTGSCKSFSACC
ncbi:MAG TPA: hypothetical protein VH637_05330 [Streptosporangiaceae bacterium]|jgi:hypothetical protein